MKFSTNYIKISLVLSVCKVWRHINLALIFRELRWPMMRLHIPEETAISAPSRLNTYLVHIGFRARFIQPKISPTFNSTPPMAQAVSIVRTAFWIFIENISQHCHSSTNLFRCQTSPSTTCTSLKKDSTDLY